MVRCHEFYCIHTFPLLLVYSVLCSLNSAINLQFSWKLCITSIGPPSDRVILQELASRYNLTAEQLNSEIEHSDFPCLALYFDNVDIYSHIMELTASEQADVKMLYFREGTQAAMVKCLLFWRTHNPFTATYRALLELLLGLRKERIADQICQHLLDVSTVGYSEVCVYREGREFWGLEPCKSNSRRPREPSFYNFERLTTIALYWYI